MSIPLVEDVCGLSGDGTRMSVELARGSSGSVSEMLCGWDSSKSSPARAMTVPPVGDGWLIDIGEVAGYSSCGEVLRIAALSGSRAVWGFV